MGCGCMMFMLMGCGCIMFMLMGVWLHSLYSHGGCGCMVFMLMGVWLHDVYMLMGCGCIMFMLGGLHENLSVLSRGYSIYKLCESLHEHTNSQCLSAHRPTPRRTV